MKTNMKKHVKMVLYAEPGVGKSTFVSKAPNPYFICTDGNFEWLDLPDKNHINVDSWEQAKKVFNEIPDWVETVAVDLTEDLFKWCEYEYCKKNKLIHISEKGYGQGYDTTRNEFYIEISKLLNLNKNVVLIAHGITITQKDRRGVEFNKYVPSQRIPDKVWDMIEGRVRYFLRAFIRAEENENGKLIKKRYLSLIPKENEFGIARGIDESTTPDDIPLDWDTFVNTIGASDNINKEVVENISTIAVKPKVFTTPLPKVEVTKPIVKGVVIGTPEVETPVETPKVETPKVEEVEVKKTPIVSPTPVSTPKVGSKPWIDVNGNFIKLSAEERAGFTPTEKIEYIKAQVMANTKR